MGGGGEGRVVLGRFTLAFEAESRWVAAATGSFDAAEAAADEEVDPTELRVAEQEEVEEDEERSAEGRGVWMAAEGFAMTVRCGANWARGKERATAIRAAWRPRLEKGVKGLGGRWAWADWRRRRTLGQDGPFCRFRVLCSSEPRKGCVFQPCLDKNNKTK